MKDSRFLSLSLVKVVGAIARLKKQIGPQQINYKLPNSFFELNSPLVLLIAARP